MELEKIESKNVVLRKAKESDLMFIWQNVWIDDILAENMLWEPVKTKEKAKEKLERSILLQSKNTTYFVCLKQTDEPIGFAGVIGESGEYKEVGICIARKHQGKGYGKEVLQMLIKLVFECLNGKSFLYTCFSNNQISKNLCMSVGFRYVDSNSITREYDGKSFIKENYIMDKEMYNKVLNSVK